MQTKEKSVPDLSALLGQRNDRTSYRIYFCQNSPDRVYARSLGGLPQVRLFPLPGNHHNVLSVLHTMGKLKDLFPPVRLADGNASVSGAPAVNPVSAI